MSHGVVTQFHINGFNAFTVFCQIFTFKTSDAAFHTNRDSTTLLPRPCIMIGIIASHLIEIYIFTFDQVSVNPITLKLCCKLQMRILDSSHWLVGFECCGGIQRSLWYLDFYIFNIYREHLLRSTYSYRWMLSHLCCNSEYQDQYQSEDYSVLDLGDQRDWIVCLQKHNHADHWNLQSNTRLHQYHYGEDDVALHLPLCRMGKYLPSNYSMSMTVYHGNQYVIMKHNLYERSNHNYRIAFAGYASVFF